MNDKRTKTAIIGSGISGLSTALALADQDDLTVFEYSDTPGGHARTVEVEVDGQTVPVDTGFIVFNKKNYPNLVRFFEYLNVDVIDSDMSFGVSVGRGDIEYSSKHILAQKRNIFRPKFWQMVCDILQFNRKAKSGIEDLQGKTLGDYLNEMETGPWFRRIYLQAMGAAIWSCSAETILKYPANRFLKFFDNHGLLSVDDHPQWSTIRGGSRVYVSRIADKLGSRLKLGCGAASVKREDRKITVLDTRGAKHSFDRIVFACHADQTVKILQDMDEEEEDTLKAFTFQTNKTVLHTDARLMPKRKKAWASWVYLARKIKEERPSVSLSYWMNNLQELKCKTPVINTVNPEHKIDESLILDRNTFAHPVFDKAAVHAQEQIHRIQGRNQTYHCGAWLGYGFHEDGITSGLKVLNYMGAKVPWA